VLEKQGVRISSPAEVDSAAEAKVTISGIRRALKQNADERKAAVLRRFFKTGPGEYGEGDRFLGITVPVLRRLAGQYGDLPLAGSEWLLRSPVHEERLLALLILIGRYRKGSASEKTRIYRFYLRNLRGINNWDLVDLSAKPILGAYLFDRDKTPLYRLIESPSLWERRIGLLATFYFIEKNQFRDTLRMAARLLSDKEDLMHKAVGWMLREIGKRAPGVEERFLRKYASRMPRTTLRYAIERFPQAKRLAYLRKGR
jgi:3-methyladenine DNA glycosylase AlkD